MVDYQDILKFWFEEIDSKFWWKKDEAFDNQIRERFGNTHTAATKGELFSWRENPMGRLAEIIVLDQFSRNLFRNDPRSFAYDGIALVLSQECVALGLDKEIPMNKRSFLYMPFMHSESKVVHEKSMELFSQEGMSPDYEIAHKKIIDRFGRYPHRNKILGRESTLEEVEFLKGPGSSF